MKGTLGVQPRSSGSVALELHHPCQDRDHRLRQEQVPDCLQARFAMLGGLMEACSSTPSSPEVCCISSSAPPLIRAELRGPKFNEFSGVQLPKEAPLVHFSGPNCKDQVHSGL